MPVELRKRKAPAAPPAVAPPRKKQTKTKSATNAAKPKAQSNGSTSPQIAVGKTVKLDGFGGEVETHDGEKTTLNSLVNESKNGVVLFTYPKASTPGCTTQACLFRDAYDDIKSKGYSVYGLSTDSPKANTTFKVKQKLPYPLISDPKATLIGAIGYKKAPKGTTRAVFVVDKQGKILAAQPGGPAATLEVVTALLAADKTGGKTKSEKVEGKKEDEDKAEVAADVADTAAKLDGTNKA
ncbi:MAG: hypothetical protein M1825_003344 [Sarcosagium campestre]|nr:MAG: hypothetical protein M1825_003344 [Sarcosagium campestre]